MTRCSMMKLNFSVSSVYVGKNIATDMGNILTQDINTNPDRIRYFGDPISAFEFNQVCASKHMYV